MLPFPVIVLLFVFTATAFRKIGAIRFHLWQIMVLGSAAVLLTRQISPDAALKAIDLNVMLYLFGVFIIGQALEESGYLSHLAYLIFRRAGSANALLIWILFAAGFLSAFLMNDTLAIVGTPVVLLLAKRHKISPKIFLIALAFAVTTGSVMSPIGNPQNLLVAIHSGMKNPFGSFLRHLILPTSLSLAACYFVLKFFYRGHFHKEKLVHDKPPALTDPGLAKISKICLGLLLILIMLKILLSFGNSREIFSLTEIALISSLPVFLFSPKRFKICLNIDWHTLIFFAAMFILMQSVWDSGFFQSTLEKLHIPAASPDAVLGVGIAMSQLISNVPLTALYLPLLEQAHAPQGAYLALAAGSTIAGNLLILGAASNVIIIQNAEKKSGETISFGEFARAGIPLTIIQAFLYWLFLRGV